MTKAYQESSASTPMFFVLFAGVDPTPWVEGLGKTFDISAAKGTFANISMGQGQEKPAEETIEKMARIGGWVMLQNVHLMQSWLPQLDRKLEVCSETADQSFRCFISAEAPPLPYMKNMPEALLQACIKIANEAPADLKSNLTRAWASFSQEQLDECVKPKEFRSCLFGLCFFHSLVLGRKRFGAQGWSRKYGFNNGDLTICADVLTSYLNVSSEKAAVASTSAGPERDWRRSGPQRGTRSSERRSGSSKAAAPSPTCRRRLTLTLTLTLTLNLNMLQ